MDDFNTNLTKYIPYLRMKAIYFYPNNPEQAEDLLSDTLLRALVYKDTFDFDKYETESNFKNWLFTIMKSIFISSYKRKFGDTKINYQEEIYEAIHPIFHINIDSGIHLEEIQKTIYNNINELNRFILYDWLRGFSYREIGDKYDIPLYSVKNRIRLTRLKLIKLLKSKGYTEYKDRIS